MKCLQKYSPGKVIRKASGQLNKLGLRLVIISFFVLNFQSCKKFINPELPIDKQASEFVYSTNSNASAALTGIYFKISENNNTYLTSIALGLLSDEIELYNTNNTSLGPYYSNALNGRSDLFLWGSFYDCIFRINAALEGINGSSGVSENFRKQFVGEAKFLRAYCYLNLVSLFDGVPLLTTTDYKVNYQLGRSSNAQLFQFIISELTEAKELLNNDYVNSTLLANSAERIHPNKSTASALLARTYLYQKDWENAEKEATNVISDSKYSTDIPLDQVFLKNSKEAIFQIAPVENGYNTTEARNFILPSTGPDEWSKQFYLNDNLVKSFDQHDLRLLEWIGSVKVGVGVNAKSYSFPTKYKIEASDKLLEYSMVLRLSEQYLIRAESRANLGRINGTNSANDDLTKIRNRAGLSLLNISDKSSMLFAIESERRKELFTEMGHRWFDLKRTERLDAVMPAVSIHKTGSWESTDKLLPIPNDDMLKAPNLKPQNPGY